jgi:TIR domain
MEELSTDSSAPEPRYDVYFSYRKTDEQREAEISRCLLAVIPDFHGFDDSDFIPGRYVITQRENALAASGSVAVLCGPNGPSQMAVDELSHAFQLSMGQGTPVFPVYLPDWNGDVPGWLRHRSPVDLQHQFDEDRLLRDGLVAMIAAVQKMKIRDADRWLSEREPPPPGPSARPPELRALVVGIQHYQLRQL